MTKQFSPAPFSSLISCSNEAAVTDKCNYMTKFIKTKRNKRFSFVLRRTKGLQRKTEFFAYVISGERSANRPRQLWNGAFHVKTSQSVKN